jgi:hypothetical protein
LKSFSYFYSTACRWDVVCLCIHWVVCRTQNNILLLLHADSVDTVRSFLFFAAACRPIIWIVNYRGRGFLFFAIHYFNKQCFPPLVGSVVVLSLYFAVTVIWSDMVCLPRRGMLALPGQWALPSELFKGIPVFLFGRVRSRFNNA